MQPKPLGTKPRERVLIFPFGTTHTKQYGALEFDHADALAVMHEYNRLGNLRPVDVEHATQNNGPPEWQDSHAYASYEVDAKGLHAILNYNANGLERVTSRKQPYDSPVVRTWRGNHIRSVDMLSLVKEPARNGSTPLLMNGNSDPAKTEPTLQQKVSTELHSALGTLVNVLNEANKDPELAPIVVKLTACVTDPAVELNQLMQAKGIVAKPVDESADKAKLDTATGQANMSGQASPLEVLGAEVMTRLQAKSPDEALGALDALRSNSQKLLSAHKQVSGLLLLNAVMSGKVKPDEVQTLSGKSPEYIERNIADRVPSVTMSGSESRQATGDPPADLTPVTNMLARYGLKA
jgi:phage I-like protein